MAWNYMPPGPTWYELWEDVKHHYAGPGRATYGPTVLRHGDWNPKSQKSNMGGNAGFEYDWLDQEASTRRHTNYGTWYFDKWGNKHKYK